MFVTVKRKSPSLNRKRWTICINCIHQLVANVNIEDRADAKNVCDNIVRSSVRFRRLNTNWKNPYQWYSTFRDKTCDDCEYVLEHTLLEEQIKNEKT